uniref:Uncharacterized protein n=1 Tax=Romanomermis culicivorax TaxID=13658 RepID=A0A915HQ03_ROMCU
MKLHCEYNARQEGAGSNFHALYASCQSKAAGLTYTIAKAVLQDKKEPEPKYANIQVWKKETDNTDPRILFWEVIDRKKAQDILEVEKSLKKKIGYGVKHAHNRPAASRVSKRWTRKDSDVRKREKLVTPEKERRRKHESRHRDESRHKKSMSKEKKRRENEEESWRKEIEDYEEKYKRREKEKRESKERKGSRKSRSQKRTPGYYQHDDRLDVSYSSRATSLDRSRANETTQQGVLMSDLNAMMQAQQQQPNIAQYDRISVAAFSSAAIPGYAISAGSTAILPPILGSAQFSDAAAYDNPADT